MRRGHRLCFRAPGSAAPTPNFPPASSRSPALVLQAGLGSPRTAAGGCGEPSRPDRVSKTASGDGGAAQKVVTWGLRVVRGAQGTLPCHALGADIRAEGRAAVLRVLPLAGRLDALCRLVWGGRQAHARAGERERCSGLARQGKSPWTWRAMARLRTILEAGAAAAAALKG